MSGDGSKRRRKARRPTPHTRTGRLLRAERIADAWRRECDEADAFWAEMNGLCDNESN